MVYTSNKGGYYHYAKSEYTVANDLTNQCKIVTDVQNTITILFKDALASIMFWLYMQRPLYQGY